MKTNLRSMVFECFLDLGITVVYASLVGMVIVSVVASDDGPGTLPQMLCYAALLPLSVILLIALDLGLRLIQDRRKTAHTRTSQLGLAARR